MINQINVYFNFTEEQNCSYPWRNFNNECLYISEKPSTWYKSRMFCKTMKGDLANPSDIPMFAAYFSDLKYGMILER